MKRSSSFQLVCLHLGKQTAESKPKSEMCIQIFNMGSQKPKPLLAEEKTFGGESCKLLRHTLVPRYL